MAVLIVTAVFALTAIDFEVTVIGTLPSSTVPSISTTPMSKVTMVAVVHSTLARPVRLVLARVGASAVTVHLLVPAVADSAAKAEGVADSAQIRADVTNVARRRFVMRIVVPAQHRHTAAICVDWG